MSVFLVLIIYILIVALFISMAIAGMRFAPWVPSRRGSAKRALLLAGFKPGEAFVDLGSGDGRVAMEAAGVEGCQATGVELTWYLHLIAKIRARINRSSVCLVHGSLFDYYLGKTDIVYLFGTGDNLGEKLVSKLRRELPPGARVVSRGFKIPGLELVDTSESPKLWDTLFLYRV